MTAAYIGIGVLAYTGFVLLLAKFCGFNRTGHEP